MFPCMARNLLHLGFGDVTGVNATNSSPFIMHFEHDLCRLFTAFGKKLLQNTDDKIHRCEIIVQYQHLVEWWGLELCVAGRKRRMLDEFCCHTELL